MFIPHAISIYMYYLSQIHHIVIDAVYRPRPRDGFVTASCLGLIVQSLFTQP